MIGGLIYGSIGNVSLNQVGAVAYAADDWQDLESGDIVSAFQAYCKSRNILVEGSAAYAATTWTTSTFNRLCDQLGIDITELQAQIKKKTDGNLGTRWLFSVTGVTGFNRIAAELLQNNNLSVGDANVHKNVYSGKIFSDDDGNKCLIYIISSTTQGNGTTSNTSKNNIVAHGTYLKYSNDSIYDGQNISFNINGNRYSSVVRLNTGNGVYTESGTGYTIANADAYYFFKSSFIEEGCITVYYVQNENRYYLGSIGIPYEEYLRPYYKNTFNLMSLNVINPNSNTDTDVYINTPDDDPIEPQIPEDEPIEIGDDGDTSGGGGGDGGGDEPSDPDNWEPTTPTIPDPSSPDFPSVEIPDIDIPDLPSLNFSLGDLSEKFPFSIPFDAIAV